MRKGPMNRDDLDERIDAMVTATDAFCAEYLTEEFGEVCANLTHELAVHHEDLLLRDSPRAGQQECRMPSHGSTSYSTRRWNPTCGLMSSAGCLVSAKGTRVRSPGASWTPWT